MLRLQALQIIEGLCRALDHAHRNGSVHGDVQPEKIFVTSEGQVRLIGHGGRPTPAYAGCEVLEGAEPVAADDLFSTACTGYQLLAGESPFGAGTALQAEAAAQRPARISHLSPGQWRALDRALAFRRAERQPDIETFLDELRSQYPGQSEGDATASVPSLPITHKNNGRGLRLSAMAAGMTGIAAIIIALGWWLLRTPEAPVSTTPTAVATARPEIKPIVRPEIASAVDTATAVQQPQTANTQVMPATPPALAATAQPVPGKPPGPRAAEPASSYLAPTAASVDPATAVSASPAGSAAGESQPRVAEPIEPLSVPPIAPRPVAPALPALSAPAVSLPGASASDSDIYMVPFSSLKVRRYVDPDYPRNSEGIRMAGWVDVGFGVDEQGRTTDLQVTAAEPTGLFDEAALSAVRRWRFAPVEPPTGPEQKVRSEIRVRFTPD